MAWSIAGALAGAALAQPAPPGPAPAPAAAAIALLPLDADARLEIYGQPVASELARALRGGDLDVVVVGANGAVPERARLIVDGTLARKGAAVVVTLRIRNPADGTTLQTMTATAASLATIDRAAAELAQRIVPVVRERLAALARPAAPDPGEPPPVRPPLPPAVPVRPPILVAIAAAPRVAVEVEPLRGALDELVPGWARDHHREPRAVDASTLLSQLAPRTVESAGVERGIAFEVLRYEVVWRDGVPLGRARVRVRMADANGVAFDRVVATDTVVGARQMAAPAMARLVAREVLAIVQPHLRRLVRSW